jgi:D-alanyl-D-alanine dipeptidase
MSFLILFILVLPTGHASDDLVFLDAKTFDFSIVLDIRYATPKNFLKQAVYPEARCLLRSPVAKALSRVQSALKLLGLRLKVFDCYRSLSVQKKMWALVADEKYVADPSKGSRHNRGAAVDVTLVDSFGKELEMPSDYDDFSEKAARACPRCPPKAKANRVLLEKKMMAEGFVPFDTEWWHFDFKGWERFPIEDVTFSSLK